MSIKVCVFDAYGTLFDVTSAAREAADEPDFAVLKDRWQAVAEKWRLKQLQYSWLRAVAGRHCDFWKVTQDGLDWALASEALEDAALRERLLSLYWELAAYPEVARMLAEVRDAGCKAAILSNGSPEMLEAAVRSAGIEGLLEAVLSVEDVGVFKPHSKVYDMVGSHFGCARDEVFFVSSNGWDAAGAADYGFCTAWVNRAGEPVDRLYAEPHHVLSDLTTIPELIT